MNKVNKKIILYLVFLCLVVTISPLNVFGENPITVYVNGEIVVFSDAQPIIIKDRTLVPIRGIFENLGYEIMWDSEGKQVALKLEKETPSEEEPTATSVTEIILTVDSTEMKVVYYTTNTSAEYARFVRGISLDVAPQIINDRVMIPLRAIGEAANIDVSWSQADKSIVITQKDISQ